MIKRVLIIGGYGTFGSLIARSLAQHPQIQLIIAGRSAERANAFIQTLSTHHTAETAIGDINANPDDLIQSTKPDIVIHTSGPFQEQNYAVAESCIRHSCHYLDLADGRDFVSCISDLDAKAKAAGVLIVSGASSVPALTSAVIDRYKDSFDTLDSVDYAITTAQKTMLGLATTKGVLSYAGKPFTTAIDGRIKIIYGWQGLKLRYFRKLGWRFLGYCDIPDLSLFPRYYPQLKTIRFYAGAEFSFVHLGLWCMTWLVRLKLIRSLADWAESLLNISRWLDYFSSNKSGFYMQMEGHDKNNKRQCMIFDIAARNGEGMNIPTIPAILLATRLAEGTLTQTGATPCIGLIGLDDYLDALKHYQIDWSVKQYPEKS